MIRCNFPDCDVSANTAQEMLNHISEKHTPKDTAEKENTINCGTCGKTYKNRKSLLQHIRDVHKSINTEPYQCDQCGGVFARKSHLARHERRMGHNGHTRKNTVKYEHACTECERRFVRRDALKRHVERFHTPGRVVDHDFSSDEDEENLRPPLPMKRKAEGSSALDAINTNYGSDSDPDIAGPSTGKRRKRQKQTVSEEEIDNQLLDVENPFWEPHPDVDWVQINPNDPTVGGLIQMIGQSQRQNKELRATETISEFRFTQRARELAAGGMMLQVIYGILEKVVAHAMSINQDRFLQIILDSPNVLDFAVYGILRPVDPHYDLLDLMDRLESVLGSKSDFSMDHNMRLTLRTVKLPSRLKGIGGPTKPKHYKSFLDLLFAKTSTWNSGGIGGLDCVLKSVVAGLKVKEIGLEAARKESWWSNRDDDQRLNNMVQRLADKLDLSLDRMLVVNPDFDKIQAYLNDQCGGLQLRVFDDISSKGINQIYLGDSIKEEIVPEQDQIILAVCDQHCFLINSLAGVMGKRKMCNLCFKLYDHEHCCSERVCYVCLKQDCDAKKRRVPRAMAPIFCEDCNVHFQTRKCYRNHMGDTCEQVTYHAACGRIVDRASLEDGSHDKTCLVRICPDCKKTYKEDPLGLVEHRCMIDKVNLDKLQRPAHYRQIVYDFEATFDKANHTHIPYCVTAIRSCEDCNELKHLKLLKCRTCGDRRHKFWGRKARDRFFDWLFYNPQNAGAICLSHNGGSYDHYFSLRYCLDHDITPEVIANDSRLLQLKAGRNVKLRDTYLMFGGSVRKMPKTFGFEDKAAKTWFPHKLDAFEYLDYEGPPVPIEEYMIENMDQEEMDEFLPFHANITNFSFRKTCEEYCMTDTEVTLQAVQIFESDCINTLGIAPFQHAMTTAQLASLVYRSKFMEDTLFGRVPPNNYASLHNNSQMALKHLAFIAHKRNINIRTAANGKEVRIAGIPIDGHYRSETTQHEELFQISGCYHHACMGKMCAVGIKQRPDLEHSLHKPMRNCEVYNRTMNQIRTLRNLGYTVHHIWEHTIKDRMKNDPEYRDFCNALSDDKAYSANLEPRDSLFGGRTEVFKLCEELSDEQVKAGKRISYVDVVSLYPKIMVTADIPLGNPTILYPQDLPQNGEMSSEEFEEFFGLADVTVQPPKGLRFPVLPKRFNGKLCFSCCNLCAETKQDSDCTHTAEERAMRGTWVTDEILLALENGYELKKVHKIWQYDRYTSDGFKPYIAFFLKQKTESSGMPQGYTEATLPEFKAFFDHLYNTDLDIEKIVQGVNPGRRTLAKLMLNSLWGKFGQSLERTENQWTSNYDELVETLCNPDYEIVNMEFSAAASAFVAYRPKKASLRSSHPMHSPVVASYVTANARIFMFQRMKLLGGRLLYMDTDSFIYVANENEASPLDCGPFLGQFTDELQFKENGEIVKDFGIAFYGSAPKSYSLVCNSGKVHTKCKGIKNTVTNKKLLTSTLMKALVLSDVDQIYQNYEQLTDEKLKEELQMMTAVTEETTSYFPCKTIRKVKSQGILRNTEGFKGCRRTFDKRRILPNLDTLPFGY